MQLVCIFSGGADVNLFNNAAQLASYPYIYDGEFEHSIKYDLEKMLLFYALSRFFCCCMIS